jgi:hypothetical protein
MCKDCEKHKLGLREVPLGEIKVARVEVELWDEYKAVNMGFPGISGYVAVAINNEGFIVGAKEIKNVENDCYRDDEGYRNNVLIGAEELFGIER